MRRKLRPRQQILRAREIQLDRFAGAKSAFHVNAQMGSREIRKYCDLGTEAERLLERAIAKQGLSPWAHDRILKVALRIANVAGGKGIESGHIAEAI